MLAFQSQYKTVAIVIAGESVELHASEKRERPFSFFEYRKPLLRASTSELEMVRGKAHAICPIFTSDRTGISYYECPEGTRDPWNHVTFP